MTLAKADYYELRAAVLAIDAVELQALKAALAFGQEATATRAHATALALRHKVDLTASYDWDDATCSLRPVSASQEAGDG